MVKHHTVRHSMRSVGTVLLLGVFLLGGMLRHHFPMAWASASDAKRLSGRSVNFMVAWTHMGAAEALAKWFKVETGATLKIIKIDYHDLLQTTIDDFNSAAPQLDVVMIWYVHLGRLAQEGILVNLDDFYTRHANILQPADFIPKIFDGHTLYNGRRWSVPFDGDTHVLFYRKSIFAKHNLVPPQTWDQYTAAAKLITQKEKANGIYGAAIMAHPTPVLIVSSFMNRLGGYGGVLLDQKMVPKVNSPEAVAALTAMVEQSKYALPTPLETDFSVSRDAFLLGQVAMVEQWTDIGIMAEDENQSFIRGDWGAAPMPRGSGPNARRTASLNAGWTLGLSSKAPNREVAEEFLLFAARPDIALRLNMIPGGGGIDPTRISTVRSPHFKKFAPVISKVEASMLDGAMIVWPNHPKVPELMTVLSDSIVAAIEKRKTPKAALDFCQLKWIAIINQDKP